MGYFRVGPSKKVSSCSFLRTQRTVLQTGLRKKEGYFGVGFFLSPLSPPPHRPIRHPHSTTTPHPYHSLPPLTAAPPTDPHTPQPHDTHTHTHHSHQPPAAPRGHLLSQSREQGEYPQVGFFWREFGKRKVPRARFLFSGKAGKKQGTSKIGFFGKKAPWGWFLLGRKFSEKILVKPTKRPCIEVSVLR